MSKERHRAVVHATHLLLGRVLPSLGPARGVRLSVAQLRWTLVLDEGRAELLLYVLRKSVLRPRAFARRFARVILEAPLEQCAPPELVDIGYGHLRHRSAMVIAPGDARPKLLPFRLAVHWQNILRIWRVAGDMCRWVGYRWTGQIIGGTSDRRMYRTLQHKANDHLRSMRNQGSRCATGLVHAPAQSNVHRKTVSVVDVYSGLQIGIIGHVA